jgi:diacylglycerol kinase (ATP)
MSVPDSRATIPVRARATAGPSAFRRITVIHNPHAGRGRRGALAGWLASLRRRGIEPRCVEPATTADAARLAARAAEAGADLVIAAGGDGTIHEVVNGLLRAAGRGRAPVLAVLPLGTANVVAAEIGIGTAREGWLELIERGRRVTVDVGRAGERWFLACAGIGADAAAIRRVSLPLKRALGRGAYAAAALTALVADTVRPFELVVDGGRAQQAAALLVTNIRAYAGPLLAVPEADPRDGLFDLLAVARGGVLGWGGFGLRLLAGPLLGGCGVEAGRARVIEVLGPAGLPVQLDGDLRELTPVTLELEPARLELLVPPGYRAPPARRTRALTMPAP